MTIEIITPYTSFLLGLLASVSTCLVVVGGLVLSLSAKVAQDDLKNRRVFYLFHSGRVIGFAFLGGVLGVLGGVLAINQAVVTCLNLLVALVMLVLGLNLIGILQGKTLKLPRGLFDQFTRLEHSTLAPFLLGVGTFFFPCGFTQSAQVAALASGSFSAGAALMAAFALGTLPMLLALSFGTVGLAETKYARIFFKIAGVTVLGLSLFTLWSSLVAFDLVRPIAPTNPQAEAGEGVIRDGVQYATIVARNGYRPELVALQAGVPTKLVVQTDGTYDCSAALSIPALGYTKLLAPSGEEVIDLGARTAGEEIRGTCSMGMFAFTLRFE